MQGGQGSKYDSGTTGAESGQNGPREAGSPRDAGNLAKGDSAPEPPGYDALAQRLIDFWQAEAAVLMRDPARLAHLRNLFDALQPGESTADSASRDSTSRDSTFRDFGGARVPPGAAPPGAASGGGRAGNDEFARRLALVEQRLARLERRCGIAEQPDADPAGTGGLSGL